jgi:hypothetical protein
MLVDDPMVGVVVGSFCGFVVMISIAGFGCGLPRGGDVEDIRTS